MAGVTRLLLALQEISLPGDLPGECDLGLALKHFFERSEIQTLMVQMNQTQLYDKMENRSGFHIERYKDKTLKHKIRHDLPIPFYSYYETGATHESLEVFADEESVGIWPGENAPEYAFLLDGSAWGLNNEHFNELCEEKKPQMVEEITNHIRAFLNNG